MIKNKLSARIYLSVFSVFLFLIITELFLRLFNVEFNLNDYVMKFNKQAQIDVQIADGDFLKDPVLFWTKSPDKWCGVNSFGLRDRRENMEKSEDVFRIICLGGSVTYGAPSEPIKPEDTYAKQLEVILNSRLSDKKVDVINAGVPGYTSYQGLKYLTTKIIKYDPDLVVVLFGHNDASPAVYFEDKEQICQPAWLMRTQNILIKSKFYQILSKLIFVSRNNFIHSKMSLKAKKYRVSSMDYKNNLALMAEFAIGKNIKIVFLPPMIYEDDTVFYLDGYYLPTNVIIIDYLSRFQKEKNKKTLFFNDNCHLTARGHRILAEEIANFLIKKNLINAEK